MNPGYKTTEFWTTIIAFVFGILTSTGVIPADTDVQGAAALITGAVAVVYTIARAIVKKANAGTPIVMVTDSTEGL